MTITSHDVWKSSVAKSDGCPIFDWWILEKNPAETRRHDRRSVQLRAMNGAEIWANKQQQFEPVQMFSDVFSTLFWGTKTSKNHQNTRFSGRLHGFFQGDLRNEVQGAGAGQSWQPHGGRRNRRGGPVDPGWPKRLEFHPWNDWELIVKYSKSKPKSTCYLPHMMGNLKTY